MINIWQITQFYNLCTITLRIFVVPTCSVW